MFDQLSPTKYFNKVCNEIAKKIAKCTPQLFIVKNYESQLPPSPLGSAVLFRVNQRFLLITAAHCVHELNLNHVGVMIGRDFVTIGGSLIYHEPNEGDYFHPNNLDIAAFELDPETSSAIKEIYSFADWSKVGIDREPTEESRYLIFGYPGAKTAKYLPTKEIRPLPLVLRTIGVSEAYYLQEQIDRNKTIVLAANQKHVGRACVKELEELPTLGGISGCGYSLLSLSK